MQCSNVLHTGTLSCLQEGNGGFESFTRIHGLFRIRTFHDRHVNAIVISIKHVGTLCHTAFIFGRLMNQVSEFLNINPFPPMVLDALVVHFVLFGQFPSGFTADPRYFGFISRFKTIFFHQDVQLFDSSILAKVDFLQQHTIVRNLEDCPPLAANVNYRNVLVALCLAAF